MARTLKYKSAQELQAAIDGYFAECEGEVLLDEGGRPVLYQGAPVRVGAHPPTVTGLAYTLGFASRQGLLNYQGRKGFNDAITRAKLRIESYTEGRLYDRDGARGAQFSLQHNFRWRDDEAKRDDGGASDGLLEALSGLAAGMATAKDDSEGLPPGAGEEPIEGP